MEVLQTVRLDQWLWAARFFKTRSQARAAIVGGKVRYAGMTTKPGKAVEVGASLCVQRGQEEWTVLVTALGTKRGSAAEAAKLYEETLASAAKREQARFARLAERENYRPPSGRPDRKERGKIIRFQRREKS